MRTALKLILLLLMTSYLIFVVVRFSTHEDSAQCKGVEIVIADSAQATLITEDDVDLMLRKQGLHPIGRTFHQINLAEIENFLFDDPFVRNCICMKTPDDAVKIYVEQHLPLLRILSDSGEDYYIDEKGNPMAARGYEADLAVATGNIDKKFAQEKLLAFGKILRSNEFWNDQIQQIHVRPDGNIDLTMRVGEQVVHLGQPEHIEQKLRNLRAFYDKILPKVGWHRYKEYSIAFENQVIGCK